MDALHSSRQGMTLHVGGVVAGMECEQVAPLGVSRSPFVLSLLHC